MIMATENPAKRSPVIGSGTGEALRISPAIEVSSNGADSYPVF